MQKGCLSYTMLCSHPASAELPCCCNTLLHVLPYVFFYYYSYFISVEFNVSLGVIFLLNPGGVTCPCISNITSLIILPSSALWNFLWFFQLLTNVLWNVSCSCPAVQCHERLSWGLGMWQGTQTLVDQRLQRLQGTGHITTAQTSRIGKINKRHC